VGFNDWLVALEARHLADLRVPEVTRALRALSSAYVERRGAATLDTAGKRAAFALFYAPLHFLAVSDVIRALGAEAPAPSTILDLGCGTGVAGAAWALASGADTAGAGTAGTPTVTGLDRHPWAVEEARWTYRQLGLHGRAKQGDAARLPRLARGSAVIAAYTLNELPDPARAGLARQLLDAAGGGAAVLIVEPISRRVSPWWDGLAARAIAAGGRADEWKFDTALPPLVERFDRAAGLHHRINACRSLYVPAAPASSTRS
jgi:SAM-dependent methyltransferase